jgi:quercetin dioxygenase-like cupin family protein
MQITASKIRMIRCALGLIVGVSIAGSVRADEPSIRTIEPHSVALTQQAAGPSSAFLVGGNQRAGLYVITALYPDGLKSRPHTHPDQRVMTVISGTFYAGTGPTFDDANVRALEPGSVLIIPPNTLHWGWAKDGDVWVEEVGIGPTGTQFPAETPAR